MPSTLADMPLGTAAAHLPGPDLRAAEILGRSGLRDPAALRHGNGCRHFPHRDFPAVDRPGALVGRLRAAVAPPDGRPLRRQPVPPAALLPVPGRHQTLAARHPRSVPRIAARARLRHARARRALRRGQLGISDARRLGSRLGSLAERHGSHAVHLLPAGRRARLQTRHGRNHLRARAPRDVSAGRREHLRHRVDRRAARAASPIATCSIRTKWSSRPTTSNMPTPPCCCGISTSTKPPAASCSRRSSRCPRTSR